MCGYRSVAINSGWYLSVSSKHKGGAVERTILSQLPLHRATELVLLLAPWCHLNGTTALHSHLMHLQIRASQPASGSVPDVTCLLLLQWQLLKI